MADVILQVTIKDAHTARVLQAINAYADKDILCAIGNTENRKWNKTPWQYAERQTGENNKSFAERMLRMFLVSFVKHYEYNIDLERYTLDIGSVIPADENVPDDIIE